MLARPLIVSALAIVVAGCTRPGADAATTGSSDRAPAPSSTAAAPSARDTSTSAPAASANASASASADSGPTFAEGDTWVGSYSCRGNAGATSLQLRISRGVPAVSAVFSFATKAKRVGAFNVSGGYDAATRQLTLSPRSWIKRPPGFVSVGLAGKLSADGQTLSGSVTGGAGCTSFTVHRGVPATPGGEPASPGEPSSRGAPPSPGE